MALIKCEDCGKEVSNKAKACIHCGCPIEIKKEEKVETPEIEVARSECDDRAIMIWLMIEIIASLICLLTIVGIILLPIFIYIIYYTLTSKKEYIVVTNKRLHGINWGFKKVKFDIQLANVAKLTYKNLFGMNYIVVKTKDDKSYTFDYVLNANEISEAFKDVKKDK